MRRPRILLLCFWIAGLSGMAAADVRDVSPQERAFVLWQEGYILHVLGQYDAAIERFRESISVHATAAGHTYLAWSLSEQGHLEQAVEECKKAVALDPDYGNPYNDIGAYLIELGRPAEAIPWLEKAMAAKRYCCPQFAHFNLGRALVMTGEVTAARRQFERALEIDPEYVPARRALRMFGEDEKPL